MTQIHLRAEVGDYAPLVLLPGDPNRARRVAELFDGGLEQARLVNDHRGMLGFTGTYKDRPVSVQTSGMGTPSTSIVVEELLNLGATALQFALHVRSTRLRRGTDRDGRRLPLLIAGRQTRQHLRLALLYARHD